MGAPLLGGSHFGFPGASKAAGAHLHDAPDMGLFRGAAHGAGEAKFFAIAFVAPSNGAPTFSRHGTFTTMA